MVIQDRYAICVDTRHKPSALWSCYEEYSLSEEEYRELHTNHFCVKSPIAALCGLNLKVCFKSGTLGPNKWFVRDGYASFALNSPDCFATNNGAATFLLCHPETGLAEYIVNSEAYIILDEGRTDLTRNQVWGIQELINCAMDIYDMDPESMAEGREAIEEWTSEYRSGVFEPPSGDGGINIYREGNRPPLDERAHPTLQWSAGPDQLGQSVIHGGERVKVFGLQNAVDLNGRHGKVTRRSHDGRWTVKIDGLEQLKNIRERNLKIVR